MQQGDIVTVNLPESTFHEAQGQVVSVLPETEEENIVVKLGLAHEYLMGHCATEEEGYLQFFAKDLQKDDEWSWRNRASIIFGKDNWHNVFTYKEKFVPGQPCCHAGCNNPTTRRIMINIWGSVMEKDVCAHHAEQYHGKRLDSFPDK